MRVYSITITILWQLGSDDKVIEMGTRLRILEFFIVRVVIFIMDDKRVF